MSATVLGNLSLGYQLVWDRAREARAVHLRVEPRQGSAVEAAHLLRILRESWSGQAPQLILSTTSPPLLIEFLRHAEADGAWIAVHQAQLQDAHTTALVQAARQRGVQLLWRGEPGQQASEHIAPAFARGMILLTAGEVLEGLHATRQKQQLGQASAMSTSPVMAEQIYEDVPSRTLADHCLDEQGAWGVAGWPTDDVLMRGNQQQMHPDRDAIQELITAVDADVSIELIEHAMDAQPVLVYRFMLYLNSAALSLRNPAESLRHGLMMLGLSAFKRWLEAQLPSSGSDIDLQPVRTTMVVHARLTESLLDAGDEEKLRRELYLCALLSDVHRMLGEPLHTVLHRLMLPERISAALLSNSGPYAPYLSLATALGGADMAAVPALCETHELDIAEVNRVLLRVLAQLQVHAPPLKLR